MTLQKLHTVVYDEASDIHVPLFEMKRSHILNCNEVWCKPWEREDTSLERESFRSIF